MDTKDFKAWRHALTYSQQEAAQALGISRASIANYEAGKRSEDGRPVVIPKLVELACSFLYLEAVAHNRLESDELFQKRMATETGLPTEGEGDRARFIFSGRLLERITNMRP